MAGPIGGSGGGTSSQSSSIIGAGGSGFDISHFLNLPTGDAYSSSFQCTTELQRLPSNPCKFVFLSNWNAGISAGGPPAYDAPSADGLYENAGFEIYYGFRGVAGHQLFPSQSSPFLPISNTDLISVRVREGSPGRYVWFSWFV